MDDNQKESFNPYTQWETSTGKSRSDFFLQMQERCMVKLNALEEYEDIALVPDDALVEFWDIMSQCNSVYGVPPAFLRYCSKKFQTRVVAGAIGTVDHALEQGIEQQGLNKNFLPLIPIMEYKLVPTGSITWFDATKPRKQRFYERMKASDAYEKRKIKRRKHGGGRPRKKKPEEELISISEEKEDE